MAGKGSLGTFLWWKLLR